MNTTLNRASSDKHLSLISEEDLEKEVSTSIQNNASWHYEKDNIDKLENSLLFESITDRGEIHKFMEEDIHLEQC